MIKPEIIIGTDFSDQSTIAIEAGLNWSKLLQCDPTIVHVNTTQHNNEALAYLTPQSDQRLRDLFTILENQLSEKLAEQTKVFKAHYQIKDQLIQFGSKMESLLDIIKTRHGKLLVLGTQGHGALENMFLGSTTTKALRMLPCPILAIKNKRAINPQKIIFLTDLKETSQFAFEWAKILAQSFQAKLTLVHSISSKPSEQETSKSQIVNLQKTLNKEGISSAIEILTGHDHKIEKQLLQYCSATDVDLVVMGSEGRNGLQRIVLGSVAEYLAQKLPHSLFLVKNPT